MIINLYRHRRYILTTAWADLRTRYAGSVMGVVWNVAQPLALILTFSIVFSTIMKGERGIGAAKVPFPLYLCSGLLPWLAFSECVSQGTASFVANAPYLRKLPIPEQVFIAQTALSSTFTILISFTILIIVSIFFGHYPTPVWILLPVPLLLFLGLGFGIAMGLSSINVFIRDVGQMVPIVLQIGFWAYPICYSAEWLPDPFGTLIKFNPAYPYIESVRAIFLLDAMPSLQNVGLMFAWTFVACTSGYLVMRRLRPELRDVL
ncbi:MAG: ABC transporter permease [Phycisphaerales bacterium]|nr:ABC transporter permease [Phycisphaerales bacterium]